MENEDWGETTLNERVAYICKKFFKGSPTDMSNEIGVPRTTIRSVMEENNRSPRAEVLQKIVAFTPISINPVWLLTGTGGITTDSGLNAVTQVQEASTGYGHAVKYEELKDKYIAVLEERDALVKENYELKLELEGRRKNKQAPAKTA